MRLILACLFTLTCIASLPAPAHAEFTQADRERMIQMITKIEEMDKRLDDLRADMNQRFAELRQDMNKRLEEQRQDMNKRLEEQRADMNKRLEEQRTDTNQRFAELREDMNARFTNLTNLMMAIIGAFVAIVIMAIGFALWDRRTMLRPVEEKVGKLEKLLVDHVEPRLQDVEGKVETVATQSTQSAQAEAGRRKRVRDVIDDLQSRGGDDARLAGVLRGLL